MKKALIILICAIMCVTYRMEYTCQLCGEKTQEIITIIPPEGPES